MLRRFCECYLFSIGMHDWSLFRRHGDLFRRTCQSCGEIQTLRESDLNYRRLAYDAFIKKLGKRYDNPYCWIGEENERKKVNG